MSLQGKVLSVYNNGKYAKVLVKPVIDCNGCKVCAGLLKNSASSREEREVEALTNGYEIKQGDFVKLELTEYQGTKAAILIYGLPILGFMIGILLAPYFSNIFQIEVNDLIRVVCAFAGLVVSLLMVFIYLRLKKPETFMMQVSKKLTN